uniref:Uncharacterized protein n=1 Tax=Serinus canaria TaxID=9135 RepID=A0A8C9KYC2_SERCA
MENAHAKTAEECLAFFGVSESVGLSPEQVKRRFFGDFWGNFWGFWGERERRAQPRAGQEE